MKTEEGTCRSYIKAFTIKKHIYDKSHVQIAPRKRHFLGFWDWGLRFTLNLTSNKTRNVSASASTQGRLTQNLADRETSRKTVDILAGIYSSAIIKKGG